MAENMKKREARIQKAGGVIGGVIGIASIVFAMAVVVFSGVSVKLTGTALELSGGKISLVKWSLNTRQDRTLYVGREVLDGPNELIKYFVQNVQFSSKDDNTVA